MAPCPYPQKAPAAGGKTWPLSRSPHLAPVPHLQVDVRLQGLNKIKTDSVEPYSGLSYKGFAQLSLSEFILSVVLSSSGCMLLLSFGSSRRRRLQREKYWEHLRTRTKWHRVGEGEVCEPRGARGEGPPVLQQVPESQ